MTKSPSVAFGRAGVCSTSETRMALSIDYFSSTTPRVSTKLMTWCLRVLPQSYLSRYRRDQLGRIESDPLLEDGFDFAHVGDRPRRVAVDDDEIRLLAGGNRSYTRL